MVYRKKKWKPQKGRTGTFNWPRCEKCKHFLWTTPAGTLACHFCQPEQFAPKPLTTT